MVMGLSTHAMRAIRWQVRCASRTSLLVLFVLCCLPCQAERVLMDGAGRSVTVPEHPVRIVCLAPSLADDVFRLGAGAQVMAVSDYTRVPAEAAQRLSIGLPDSPSIEKIIAIHPDLVVASVGLNRQETVRILESRGIAVFAVRPQGLAGVYRSLSQLGDALGRRREAAALLATLRAREQHLRQAAAGFPSQTVFVPIWYDPVITIGRSAYLTELLEMIGLHSVTADLPQEWPQVSLETVLSRNPQSLVLVRGGMSVEQLANRPGWNALRAVRERRVLFMDRNLELPSPVCFDALEQLASSLRRKP